MKRVLLSLVFVGLSVSAWAYDCVYIGVPWPGDPVAIGFVANPNGTDAGTSAEQLGAIELAMAAWNEEGGANIGLALAGESGGLVTGSSNGENEIAFSEGESPFAVETFAHTFLWSCWNAEGGLWESCEADIIIYSEGGGEPLSWYPGEGVPPPEDELDLVTYLTHELGHAVALGHPSPDLPEAVMSGVPVPPGEARRALAGYDRECLQALYPTGAPEDPPADDPPADDPPPDDPPADDPPSDDPPEDDPPAEDPPVDDPPDEEEEGEEGEEEEGGDSSGGGNFCWRWPYLCSPWPPYLVVSYCDFAPRWDFRCFDLCDRYPEICEYFRYWP